MFSVVTFKCLKKWFQRGFDCFENKDLYRCVAQVPKRVARPFYWDPKSVKEELGSAIKLQMTKTGELLEMRRRQLDSDFAAQACEQFAVFLVKYLKGVWERLLRHTVRFRTVGT